jgi:choloylglycine hydrolase
MRIRRDRFRYLGVILTAGLAVASTALGESGTALVIKSGRGSVLARNLDSPAGEGYVFVNKRGVVKQAFGGTGAAVLRWTSKYGSVTFNQLGREFPSGGLNEEGLVIEALAGPAAYPVPDRRPPLTELQWVQYQLDCSRSVKEVLKSDRRVRISKLFFDRHFLVADRSGKTAVVEFAGGRLVSYTGGKLPVRALAGEGYTESLRRLDDQLGTGGRPAVPAGRDPDDRFIRTAAFLQDFVWPIQGLLSDQAFSILRSVERPDTRWNIVYNVPRGMVFFKTRAHRRLKMIRLDGLDFSCGAPVVMLPVETEADRLVNERFEPYDPAKNRALLVTVSGKIEGLRTAMGPAVDEVVRRMAEYPRTCVCSPE